ncbi:hypothetical protein ACH4YO_40700 [Streptomyces noursei]|uniref:hypothetical protein n=1 Tax=Streptomyces noursei TaxID=1971 RepID=UPI0034034B12
MLRKNDVKVYVQPGDTVVVRLGWSEHTKILQVADKLMPVRILNMEGQGQLLSPASGLELFLPAPLDVMTFCQDERGWYSFDVHEVNVAWVGAVRPDQFHVYVEGRPHGELRSELFEEMRDEALRMRERGTADVEVRFVEQSRCLPKWWTTSTVVPLDIKD